MLILKQEYLFIIFVTFLSLYSFPVEAENDAKWTKVNLGYIDSKGVSFIADLIQNYEDLYSKLSDILISSGSNIAARTIEPKQTEYIFFDHAIAKNNDKILILQKQLFSSKTLESKHQDDSIDNVSILSNANIFTYSFISLDNFLKKNNLLKKSGNLIQSNLPGCQDGFKKNEICNLSRATLILARSIVHRLNGNVKYLVDIAHKNDLIFDSNSAKTIIFEETLNNPELGNIDLIGFVRGKNEVLSAPDAISVYVLRISTNGNINIIERTQDYKPMIQDIKFEIR